MVGASMAPGLSDIITTLWRTVKPFDTTLVWMVGLWWRLSQEETSNSVQPYEWWEYCWLACFLATYNITWRWPRTDVSKFCLVPHAVGGRTRTRKRGRRRKRSFSCHGTMSSWLGSFSVLNIWSAWVMVGTQSQPVVKVSERTSMMLGVHIQRRLLHSVMIV